jgi:hypothetical protein
MIAFLRGNYEPLLVAAAKAGSAKRGIQIYALDPGETTGRCRLGYASDFDLDLDQIATPDVVTGYHAIRADILSREARPDAMVCEDYKVYGHKADDHKWAHLHTAQLIGAIKVIADELNIPLYFAMAQEAKVFVTDEKLQGWGCYIRGMRHARDAQRHAILHQLFGAKKSMDHPTW